MKIFRQLELRQTSTLESVKLLLFVLSLLAVPFVFGSPAIADSAKAPKINKNTDPAILRRYVKTFDKLTREKGPKASRYATKGQLLEWLKDNEGAVKAYSKAIKMEPKNGLYRLGRANCLRYQKNHEKAEQDYTKAIALGQNNSEAFTGRALSRMLLNKFKLSIYDAEKALKLNPSSVLALYAKAASELSLGNNDASIKSISKAIEIAPRDPDLYAVRSNAYRNLGKLDKAKSDFTLFKKYSAQVQ